MKSIYISVLFFVAILASCGQNAGNKKKSAKLNVNDNSKVINDSIFMNEISQKNNLDTTDRTNPSNVDNKSIVTNLAKKTSILCECFLLNSAQVQIYDTIHGKVIGTIKNDTIEEAYYSVAFLTQKDKWIKIIARVFNTEISGWIEFQENYFGVYGANYIGSLQIYIQPNMNSKIVHTYQKYFIEPMTILDWRKDWIKVKVKTNGFISKGWVENSSLCANPYSTCN